MDICLILQEGVQSVKIGHLWGGHYSTVMPIALYGCKIWGF